MNALIVVFIATFFFNYVVATAEEAKPQQVTIVLDDEEDLKPRPMLDPDFDEMLKEYCKYEEIDLTSD